MVPEYNRWYDESYLKADTTSQDTVTNSERGLTEKNKTRVGSDKV